MAVKSEIFNREVTPSWNPPSCHSAVKLGRVLRSHDNLRGDVMPKSLLIIAGLMFVSAASLRAQDAAAVNPKTIKVTLDNEHVRVFEATLTPGWKENQHSHPTSIVYVIAGGKVRNHLPDGTTSESTYTAGQTPLPRKAGFCGSVSRCHGFATRRPTSCWISLFRPITARRNCCANLESSPNEPYDHPGSAPSTTETQPITTRCLLLISIFTPSSGASSALRRSSIP